MSVKLRIKEYKVREKPSARCMAREQKQIKIRCLKIFSGFFFSKISRKAFNIPIQFLSCLIHHFFKVFHCISVIFFCIVNSFLDFKNLNRKDWCFPLSKTIFGSLQEFPYYHSSFLGSVCSIVYRRKYNLISST